MGIISKDSTVLKQLRNSTKLRRSAIASKAIKQNENYLIEIQQDQMRGSQNSIGLNPVYSPLSQELKETDTFEGVWPHMDFYASGDFQNNMFMTSDGGFSSTDWKTNTLIQNYGAIILKPNKSTLEHGRSVVDPVYFNAIHEGLNK